MCGVIVRVLEILDLRLLDWDKNLTIITEVLNLGPLWAVNR